MLSDKINFPDNLNPADLSKLISGSVRSRRLEENLSQEALSRRSGVSLGSLKRFESRGEISLKHLLMVAVALGAGEEFTHLFPLRPFQSIDDLLATQTKPLRKRGRNKI